MDRFTVTGSPGSPTLTGDWTVERAEELLGSLTGVISARIVAAPGGKIEEIHLLTSDEVSPKQTVRNVESALLAHLDLPVDHRKISVAQTKEGGDEEREAAAAGFQASGRAPSRGERILFVGHQAENDRPHHVRMEVGLEWQGERYNGHASGADLPRTRMESVANATLRGVEAAMAPADEEGTPAFALALDGVKRIEAFDRHYVMVGVMAIAGRDVAHLSGSAAIEDSADKAVILATLQATDRWVRGRGA